ncbi:MAG TPA: DUF2252 domain-containing protein [Candidatus Acidoferrales bacterium]|nr:DUF2252 domain-containing protein [Candidatus Acidoferrales bacterium]
MSRSAQASQARVQLPSTKERMSIGKGLRERVPRNDQGWWKAQPDRPDPIALLARQNRERVKSLVPIRYARMLQSPFGFLRGAAIVMAHDLAQTANTGLEVNACGDCHLANFGGYATPERNFIFDINDFDETLPAPWEWDLKRLAASAVVAGRSQGLPEDRCREAALAAARHYREHTATLARATALASWYSRLDVEQTLRDIAPNPKKLARLRRGALRVQGRTPEVIVGKMTERVDGRRRFIDDPPFVYHATVDHAHSAIMQAVVARYKTSLRADVRILFDQYRLVDVAVKVVGVGSVGTRCGVLLFMAREDDALILQTKEATRSVLEICGTKSAYRNQGERVVTGQRIMQAASDEFLGWTAFSGHDYYIRQLRDMKATLQLERLAGSSFAAYAEVCGRILARAHARSGRAAEISGYMGRGERFDDAIARFARKYADQTERDYALLRAAVKKGKIKVADSA